MRSELRVGAQGQPRYNTFGAQLCQLGLTLWPKELHLAEAGFEPSTFGLRDKRLTSRLAKKWIRAKHLWFSHMVKEWWTCSVWNDYSFFELFHRLLIEWWKISTRSLRSLLGSWKTESSHTSFHPLWLINNFWGWLKPTSEGSPSILSFPALPSYSPVLFTPDSHQECDPSVS